MIQLKDIEKYSTNEFITTWVLRDINLKIEEGAPIIPVMHDEKKADHPSARRMDREG